MGEQILGLITPTVEKPVKNPLQNEGGKKDIECCCGNGAKMRKTELEDIKGIELTGLGGQIECRS